MQQVGLVLGACCCMLCDVLVVRQEQTRQKSAEVWQRSLRLASRLFLWKRLGHKLAMLFTASHLNKYPSPSLLCVLRPAVRMYCLLGVSTVAQAWQCTASCVCLAQWLYPCTSCMCGSKLL